MPLQFVTITGADDATDIDEMVEISRLYPFVEWGILIGTHSGKPRFPSFDWIKRLAESTQGLDVRLSLHVCGQWLEDIVDHRNPETLLLWMEGAIARFQRVQLNFHGDEQVKSAAENILAAFCRYSAIGWDPAIIFQLDGVNDELWLPTSRKFVVNGLFDHSHGAGIVPGEWPQARPEFMCGWAGGLGPENLAQNLSKIATMALPGANWWIDMETNVRTAQKLDLKKVIECLDIVDESPFVAKSPKYLEVERPKFKLFVFECLSAVKGGAVGVVAEDVNQAVHLVLEHSLQQYKEIFQDDGYTHATPSSIRVDQVEELEREKMMRSTDDHWVLVADATVGVTNVDDPRILFCNYFV